MLIGGKDVTPDAVGEPRRFEQIVQLVEQFGIERFSFILRFGTETVLDRANGPPALQPRSLVVQRLGNCDQVAAQRRNVPETLQLIRQQDTGTLRQSQIFPRRSLAGHVDKMAEPLIAFFVRTREIAIGSWPGTEVELSQRSMAVSLERRF